MGFFDRLFGSRAEAAEETRFSGEKMVVKAPIDGIVLPLEQLPDETFAAAILGPGCGIESSLRSSGLYDRCFPRYLRPT